MAKSFFKQNYCHPCHARFCHLLSSPILLCKLTNSNKKLRHNMRVNFLNDIRRLNNINKGEPKLHLVIKEQHILCLDFNNI